MSSPERDPARRLWERGEHDDAVDLWRDRVATTGRPGDILALADALAQLGRPREVVELLTAELPDLRDDDLRGLADALHLLARAAHETGDAPAAARHLGERAGVVARLHGTRDGRTLLARAAWGVALARAGRLAEATTVVDESLSRAMAGHDLTEVGILAQRARAEVAALAGDVRAAFDHAAGALADARELHGDATEATRQALLPFALAAEAAGDVDSAVEAYSTYLADAPDDDTDGFELARMRLSQLGERVPTPSLQPLPPPFPERVALTTWVRDDGDQTPEALRARWQLAESLRQAGRPTEAAEEFMRLRDEYDDVGNPELALAAWNAAAMLWEETAPPGAAEEEYREALVRAEDVLGAEAAMTVSLRHNLADSLERRGEFDGACWYFGHNVLTQPEGSLGSINARRRLAWSLALSQRPQPALLVARRGLADAENTLTPGAEPTLDIRNTLAFCLESLGDEETARELFEQNLVEAESVLGAGSRHVLPYRNNLARLYLADGRPDEALALYRTSAEVVRAAVGEGFFRDVEVLRHLAECLARAGRHAEATDAHAEYVAAVTMAEGPDAERTQRARGAWARSVVAAMPGATDALEEDRLADLDEAHGATALLRAAGEDARAERVRLRFDLPEGPDDVDDDTREVRRRIAEALSYGRPLRESAGAEAARDWYVEVVNAAADLPPSDPARSGAVLTLAFADVADDRADDAVELVADALEELARDGAWGSRAGRMYVGFLRERHLARGDWSAHDDLLARDLLELEATMRPTDDRLALARVLVAGALRRRGRADDALALVAQGVAALPDEEDDDGVGALLRIATTKAVGDPVDRTDRHDGGRR